MPVLRAAGNPFFAFWRGKHTDASLTGSGKRGFCNEVCGMVVHYNQFNVRISLRQGGRNSLGRYFPSL